MWWTVLMNCGYSASLNALVNNFLAFIQRTYRPLCELPTEHPVDNRVTAVEEMLRDGDY